MNDSDDTSEKDISLDFNVDRIISVLESDDDSFETLVRLTGLNPATDFKGVDLSGVDFGPADLNEFDFTGANLTGADLSQARVEGALFKDHDTYKYSMA